MSTTTIRSYAQFGEDLQILELFGQQKGTIVEVGAFDGVTYSNSFLLEQNGWDCVLVEPNPHLCERIRTVRNAIVFNNAAGSSPENITLNFKPGSEEYAYTNIAGADAGPLPLVTATEQIQVEQRTLDSLCAEAGLKRIDVLTVDVEGNEMAVLNGFCLNDWRPSIIIIEDNSQFRDRSIERYLSGLGYRAFKRTGVNDWYASGEGPVRPTRLQFFVYSLFKVKAYLSRVVPAPVRRLYLRLKGL